MKFSLLNQLRATKTASTEIALLDVNTKKKIFTNLVQILKSKKEEIFLANRKDIVAAKTNGKNAAFIDRLTFSEKTFASMVQQVEEIAKQEDFLGEVVEEKTITNGVVLQKIRVSLGVIGIIYESRPNITIDVAALCIKSGNAVILRGGSDAIETNTILVACIHDALKKNSVSKDVVGFIQDTSRTLVNKMLKQNQYIDVIIPRGGYELVKKVVEQSKIAVLYHASGGARIYVDKSADIDLAVNVCVNAKISRPATCNSLDTILIHKDVAKEFLQKFQSVLAARAEIRADALSLHYIKARKASEEDYATEFLDYVLCVKIVDSKVDAIKHIKKYTKNHTEGIIAEDKKVIDLFVQSVDAAALFINCSTRLHDGGVFGLGAEMGIATGKLHARGPVGAKELTTYKWVAYGKGQVRE